MKKILLSSVAVLFLVGCGNKAEKKLIEELDEYGKPLKEYQILKVEEDKNYIGVCGEFNGFGLKCLYSDGEKKISKFEFDNRAKQIKEEEEEKRFGKAFNEELDKAKFINISKKTNERTMYDIEYLTRKFGNINIYSFMFENTNYYYDKTNLKPLNFNLDATVLNQELEENYKKILEDRKLKDLLNKARAIKDLKEFANFLAINFNIVALRYFDKDEVEFKRLFKVEEKNSNDYIKSSLTTEEEKIKYRKHLIEIENAKKAYIEFSKKYMDKAELEKVKLEEQKEKEKKFLDNKLLGIKADILNNNFKSAISHYSRYFQNYRYTLGNTKETILIAIDNELKDKEIILNQSKEFYEKTKYENQLKRIEFFSKAIEQLNEFKQMIKGEI